MHNPKLICVRPTISLLHDEKTHLRAIHVQISKKFPGYPDLRLKVRDGDRGNKRDEGVGRKSLWGGGAEQGDEKEVKVGYGK